MTKFLKVKDRVDAVFAAIATGAKFISACFLLVMIVAGICAVLGRIFHFKIPVTEEIGTYSLIAGDLCRILVAVIVKGEHLTG